MLRSLWLYRGFVFASVRREIQGRYLGSLLGAAWVIIGPLAMILVYTLIFSKVMHAKLPGLDSVFAYSIYLCAGLLPWGFFAEILNRSQSVFIENGNLIKKSNFPKVCLPAIVVLASSVNFLVIFGLFLLFLLLSGQFPGAVLLAMIPALLIQTAFAIGLGVFLGTINVFFRDVGQATVVLLQFWFWFTPIVYPVTIIPEWAQPWMALNPLFPLMDYYQQILVLHRVPDPRGLLAVGLLSLAILWLGLRLFRRRAGEMVDEL